MQAIFNELALEHVVSQRSALTNLLTTLVYIDTLITNATTISINI